MIGNNVTILYDASKVFDEISDRTLILKVSGLLRGGLNIGEVGCPPDAISYNNNYANVQLILEVCDVDFMRLLQLIYSCHLNDFSAYVIVIILICITC